MTCREWMPELVDCARGQANLDRGLKVHLSGCAACRDRWEAEVQLTTHFRVMSAAAASLDSSIARRDALRCEFSRRNQRRTIPVWAWTLAAAAGLLLTVSVGHEVGLRHRRLPPPSVQSHGFRTEDGIVYEASADASALSTEDFIAVPWTPPLAQGEMVRMVHTDMYPEALASMGVEVDPAWAGNLPVELVVGEDGMPRAVRISDNGQY